MLGIRFIKSQPTVHLMQFRAGRLVREGAVSGAEQIRIAGTESDFFLWIGPA